MTTTPAKVFHESANLVPDERLLDELTVRVRDIYSLLAGRTQPTDIELNAKVAITLHSDEPRSELSEVPTKASQNLSNVEVIPPSQSLVAISPSGRVKLYGRGEKPVIDGLAQETLTDPQYDVVFALLQAGKAGLKKDSLVNNSRRGGARGTLKRLSENSSKWGEVIAFAGEKGKRYRIL